MNTIEIPRKQWSGKFDEISRKHDGWLVSLDIVMADSIGAQREFSQMPFVGISAEPTDGGTITIGVAEPTGAQVTHTIHAPTQVFLQRTKTGANAALEIESADGTKAILKFRTTAPAETLNRVLHG